ncbi:hypothetical protein ACHAW5_008138 [Stephanodiscus triporus]|uniref:GH16 domain-containing protein n=1 Tax=Stephanodiscus triporus TaxID=2934178 RepID=A0ABD3P9S8_9STRA
MAVSRPLPPSSYSVVAAAAAFVLAVPLHLASTCLAGWIDPDTPRYAMTAVPLRVVQYVPPPVVVVGGDAAKKAKASTTTTTTTTKKKKEENENENEDDDEEEAETTTDPTSPPASAAGDQTSSSPVEPLSTTAATTTTTTTTTSTTTATTSTTTAKSATPASDDDDESRTTTTTTRTYDLVFSDEFNVPLRDFRDGSDPRWTALEKNDYTNDAQHYYASDNAYTDAYGNLVIRTESAYTDVVGFDDVNYEKVRTTKNFRSAMVQSWNKFCFAGGIIEAEMSLPGRHDVGGLWPAFWLLGNLARHTYVGSSEHVWPWSSTACTEKGRTAQMVNACDRAQHYGMERGVGRGAPEIDVFEVQAGNVKAGTGNFLRMPVGQPFASHSYQVAPGRLPRPGEGWYPGPGQWYEGLRWGEDAALNIAFYGSYNHFNDDTDPASQDYWSDAISFNRQLNASHFGQFHRYRVEWELPDGGGVGGGGRGDDGGTNHGYIRWFIDDQFVMEVDGKSLHESGTGGEISSEPMYMILNTAISSQWGFPRQCPTMCPCETYDCRGGFKETCGFSEGFCQMILATPVEYKVNWVRVYQDKADPRQKVGCSTPERPTKKFIEAHEKKYKLEGDVSLFFAHPLKPIQNGGGACSTTAPADKALPESCGGESRGACHAKKKTCQCRGNWTGPQCLNPTGYDDIIWDPPDTWSDLGFSWPSLRGGGTGMIIVCVMMSMVLLAPVALRRERRRREGYKRVKSVHRQAAAAAYEQRVVA